MRLQLGFRSGNWLTAEQSSDVLKRACGDTMRAKRDYAMLALLFGCGFRRSELVALELDEVQMRQGHWAVVDLIGKGGHIRTVPVPAWVKAALDLWVSFSGVREGRIFRAVGKGGKVWAMGSPKMWSGTWSKGAAKEQGWSTLHLMTCAERVRSCATSAGVNWSKSSSYWAMRQCRRRSAIWDASRT